MAKQSGLGDNLYVAGYDLSGDIGSLSRIGGGAAVLDLTGIDKSAFERTLGVRDGALDFSSWFNPAANQAHDRFSSLPTADQILTYCRGTAIGKPAASLVGKQISYDPTRNQDGSLTAAVQAQANGFGLEWGELLTAGKRTDSAATNGASLDYGAASNFSMQAYLHVFAFTGTSAEVVVEMSSDDGAVDPFAAVAGSQFGTITSAPTSERSAQFATTLERYLRVVTTGTFTNLEFAVTVVRNETEVTF